jgi:hypothetical protein
MMRGKLQAQAGGASITRYDVMGGRRKGLSPPNLITQPPLVYYMALAFPAYDWFI